MKFRKKAQVGGLQGFILSIVTIAIVLAIGLIVLAEMSTVSKEMDITSAGNETVTLTHAVNIGTGGVSQTSLFIGATACRNISSGLDGVEQSMTIGALPPASNCSVILGVVTVNVTEFNTTSVRIDYTHYTPSGAYNSTNSIITKLATVPTWIGIIIIVALAFIVLSFFIGRRQ